MLATIARDGLNPNASGDASQNTQSLTNPDSAQHPPPSPSQRQEIPGPSAAWHATDRSHQRCGDSGSPVLRRHNDHSSVAAFHLPVGVEEAEGSVVVAQQCAQGSGVERDGEIDAEAFKKDIRDLEELLAKLNPTADEFVPSPLHANLFGSRVVGDCGNGIGFRRRKDNSNPGRKMDDRTSMVQCEEIIRRTVYVSDIDQQVTEEQLAALFVSCGQVVDCRICGDPNSVLRFAFVEFMDEEGARAALSLAGTVLGYYPVRVLPSKTAIEPVNPKFLPRSEDEREMCARTVYCTNIDKRVCLADVRLFFESVCGEVHRMRLLGDSHHHTTRIAFVEFVLAESAIAALNCSGVILGSLPIRVSPSKTPVRSRRPRPSSQ